ncbi:hypothetical protein jhhlp_006373 [Lomentospora prolificans]|uniref:DUF218 domain-containing protein n=1 Tax=Lomentospora prolificans TaxID=41688 RepID=A0A2N3N5R0_9PEZI|nr:hypothetical protein jhhlp_006373 [Lomentospora prolificans]
MPTPSHLVVVCCHGIWLGGKSLGPDESEWLIAPFQKGETPTFVDHIKAGLRCLAEDKNAVLMFSGGPTRKETQLTEARSYVNIAVQNNYFGIIPPSEGYRVLAEERALDSYYNVLFSIVDFWRLYGYQWPERLTVVSHAFKKSRIYDGHCAAIGFPLDRTDYVGVDPPEMAEGSASKEAALKGVEIALRQWTEDPHGVKESLAGKRKVRNPWGVNQDLFVNDDERRRSGLATIPFKDGYEVLDPNAPRPW